MKKAIMILMVCVLATLVLTACNVADDATMGTRSIAENTVPKSDDGTVQASPDNNVQAPPDNTEPDPVSTVMPAQPADDFDASRVIAVFTREDGSGTRDAFVSITGVGGDMYVEAVVENETNQILTKVEENQYAIGYVSVGSLSPKVKALEIDGVAPSDATIMDKSYTLQRPLLVCVNADNENSALVKDFISFMLSAEGQDISATKWTKIDTNAPAYSASGLSGTLKVGGSTSVEPLMQALSQAYKGHNPGIDIEISGGGSGTGISEATSGVIDIGMSSRALRDGEVDELTAINIALDGVAIIVNPGNPIADISIEQIKDIFTGAVTRWSDV